MLLFLLLGIAQCLPQNMSALFAALHTALPNCVQLSLTDTMAAHALTAVAAARSAAASTNVVLSVARPIMDRPLSTYTTCPVTADAMGDSKKAATWPTSCAASSFWMGALVYEYLGGGGWVQWVGGTVGGWVVQWVADLLFFPDCLLFKKYVIRHTQRQP